MTEDRTMREILAEVRDAGKDALAFVEKARARDKGQRGSSAEALQMLLDERATALCTIPVLVELLSTTTGLIDALLPIVTAMREAKADREELRG